MACWDYKFRTTESVDVNIVQNDGTETGCYVEGPKLIVSLICIAGSSDPAIIKIEKKNHRVQLHQRHGHGRHQFMAEHLPHHHPCLSQHIQCNFSGMVFELKMT